MQIFCLSRHQVVHLRIYQPLAVSPHPPDQRLANRRKKVVFQRQRCVRLCMLGVSRLQEGPNPPLLEPRVAMSVVGYGRRRKVCARRYFSSLKAQTRMEVRGRRSRLRALHGEQPRNPRTHFEWRGKNEWRQIAHLGRRGRGRERKPRHDPLCIRPSRTQTRSRRWAGNS